MKTIHLTYPNIHKVDSSVIALGYFDGVHRGHQKVIQTAKNLAKERKAALSVMTFHPHPKVVLGQLKHVRHLTPLSEKERLFKQMGVEQLFIVQFDELFSQLTPQKFVERVLSPLAVKGVVTGFNFHFGKGGQGSGEDLARIGANIFETKIVSPVLDDQLPISSTRIRDALSIGDVTSAMRLLGRAYAFHGRVVHGDQRGRVIGFPTANIEPSDAYWIPSRGVYIVKVKNEQSQFYGMMNIGIRPTFDHPEPREVIEVHLLDFQGDLYDQQLTIEVIHHLRSERKFSSVDQLLQQLNIDREQTEQWISVQASKE
ncbi:FMN adenylyltransferase /riboflavin kinase [Seinonella peptonophila]|uniref:Riboflavin biosynthesis protein n=1 Tax=Seinonella peptonophila TaxID=112248 RepID=A0A1M5AQ02_9BACL|nr:bifunctional riboflavin kinase/FAD synthetase [Seinonella peptonophila]SHF32333.1 FMN adenylyltransferase /riboflavin kinase [Seinonella peptonophila]